VGFADGGGDYLMIGRRAFIAGLGSAAAWPLAARAQDGERRIGVLMPFAESDPQAQAYFTGFVQKLAELGWTDGRNLRMEVRWAAASIDRMRMFAKELVELQHHVILTGSTPVTAAVGRLTQTIPIVFVAVADPIRAGFVVSLSRPGHNLTGFINLEVSIAGKCLQLLTEIVPGIKRAAIMFNPDTAPGSGSFFLPSFEEAAWSLKVEPITAPVHNDAEIGTVIAALGREPGTGLICIPDGFMLVHRRTITSLAMQTNVPTVGALPQAFARDGGLLSYGADIGDLFRRAAPYVDQLLRGAKPGDLPVQLPIKFQMVLNTTTAKALKLTVPPTLLAVANEVIE
jgi:putative ABC transport system substrate-binding protein